MNQCTNVYDMPKVAVFSTGDELLPAGEQPGPGQICDCNNPMLIAQLAEMGVRATDLGSVPDDYQATVKFLKQYRNQFRHRLQHQGKIAFSRLDKT